MARQGGMMGKGLFGRIAVLCALVLSGMLAAVPAHADPVPAPPVRSTLDGNGVDLISGKPLVGRSDISIGPNDHRGLQFAQQWVESGWRYSDMPTISGSTTDPIVSWRGKSVAFFGNQTIGYRPYFQDGSSLNAYRNVFTASDGTVITFSYTTATFLMDVSMGYATKITFPDGVEWNFHYNTESYQYIPALPPECYQEPLSYELQIYCGLLASQAQTFTYMRLASITSTTGYQLKMSYASNTLDQANVGPWQNLTRVTAINNAAEYCAPTTSCTLTNDWPYVSYDGYASVTDPEGRKTNYTYTSGRLTGIKPDTATVNAITYGYDTNGKIASAQKGGSTWSYAYPTTGSTTVTDPLTKTRTVAYNTDGGVTSDTNELSKATTFTYCGTSETNCPAGLLKKVTAPELNSVGYAYDARGNVTKVTYLDKAGSTSTKIEESASYPASCSNAKICNKPETTTDANGNVTNYTYDGTHGGVTSVKAPADSNGVRPETRYTYAAKQARYLTAASTWSNSGNIYVVTDVSSCSSGTAPSCVGTANERVSSVTYPGSSTANNLLPTQVTTKAGNNTLALTTALTYDTIGNLLTVDGPISGTADTTRTRYNKARQVVGQIAPDPDASGSLTHLAIKYTYNGRGQVSITQSGRVPDQTDSSWTSSFTETSRITNTFDTYGRVIRQTSRGGSSDVAVTDVAYDTLGRQYCSIVRMDPSNWSTQQTSCAPSQTTGAQGPDRVSKYEYDEVGRVTKVWSAVGVSGLSQVTQEMAYTDNGQVSWVEDAKDNRTTYTYDGFDRVQRVRYPSPTAVNTSNNADDELLTYEKTGQVETFQTRRDEVLTYNYDNLGRLISKIVPERSGLASDHTRDVYFAYDLFGNMTQAKFGSLSGDGTTLIYDALGRPTSEATTLVSGTKTLTYAYDAAGRFSSLTHPDANYFSYHYDTVSRLTEIRKNGSTSLVTFGFDNQGRPTGLDRAGSAPDQTLGYDAASRFTQFNVTNAGSNNAQWTFGYNPVGQLTSQVRDNDAYAWTGRVNVNRSYTPNGLNQYSQVAGTSFSYDTNGNLTSDGTTTFTYDVENRLVSTNGAGSSVLYYDPLGRLYRVVNASSETRFQYAGSDLIGEYDGSGNLLARYVHGLGAGDDPLVAYTGSGVADTDQRNLYSDRLGSIILTADRSGGNVQLNSYDEYGIPDGSNAGVGANGEGRFQYTGQTWIPELGMYYYKARMYSPTLGRFMQTDPIGYGDGMNRYAYVGNDPVNGVDPSGLSIVVTAPKPDNEAPSVSLGSGFGSSGSGSSVDDWYDTYDRALVQAALDQAGQQYNQQTGDETTGLAANKMKGERNRTAKPSGTDKPYKKIRSHPSRPGWIQYKDQNGKTKERPGTPDELAHLANKGPNLTDGARMVIPFGVGLGMCALAPSTCGIVDVNGDGTLYFDDWVNY